MNKSQHNVNNGLRTIARREWEAKQAAAKAEQDKRNAEQFAAVIASVAK
jgi:hypothetical protein